MNNSFRAQKSSRHKNCRIDELMFDNQHTEFSSKKFSTPGSANDIHSSIYSRKKDSTSGQV